VRISFATVPVKDCEVDGFVVEIHGKTGYGSAKYPVPALTDTVVAGSITICGVGVGMGGMGDGDCVPLEPPQPTTIPHRSRKGRILLLAQRSIVNTPVDRDFIRLCRFRSSFKDISLHLSAATFL
jgi:hypothetical protein